MTYIIFLAENIAQFYRKIKQKYKLAQNNLKLKKLINN